MDLELNDIQQELKSTVGRLLKDKYSAEAREEILRSETGWSQQMWDQFAQLGLMSLPIEEEYGGAGMGFAEVAVVMEAFGRALVLEPYLPTVVLGAGLIQAAGSADQKAELLPAVAAGELKLAFAAQEPAGRYDFLNPTTTAQASGDGYTVSGEKAQVIGGDAADTFVVTAKVDGELGLFLVKADADGVTVDPRTQADGLRSASVLFDGAAAQRLEAGDAEAAIERVLDTAQAALAAEAVGAMEAALFMTADYLKTREQFGVPIGVFQTLQHRAADAYAKLEEAKSMALYSKLAIEADTDGTSKTRHADVLAAKVIIDQSAKHIFSESIQMHGGIGMTMEYPIGHYAKRLTVIPRTFAAPDQALAELGEVGGLLEPYAADL